MNTEQLKQTIFNKGFKDVDIEYEPEEKSLYVRVWFNFRWINRSQDKLNNGWQGFEGINKEEILRTIDEFILKHQTGDWIIELKSIK